MPPSWAARPWTIDRPRPVPLPTPLVEKNGSTARRQRLRIHARAGVAARDPHIIAGLERPLPSEPTGIGASMRSVPPRGMASRALIARLRIASSSWLGSTRAGGKLAGMQSICNLDRRIERPADQIGHAVEQRADVDRARLKVLAARESEQALDQRRRPARRLKRGVDQAMRLVVGRQPAAQQVEVADDRGQQIVEIVRDAAGQLAERLELLRLVELGQREFMLPGPLLDPGFERLVGQCAGAPRSPASASSRARASYCRRRAAQRRPRKADQGRRMERPLKEGDVAERVEEPPGVRDCAPARRRAGSAGRTAGRTIRAGRRSTRDTPRRSRPSSASSVTRTKPTPRSNSRARQSRSGQMIAEMRDSLSMPAAIAASRPIGARISARSERSDPFIRRLQQGFVDRRSSPARREARPGNWSAAAQRNSVRADRDIRGSCPRARWCAS